MNDYKYIIKAEYQDGPTLYEEVDTLQAAHNWIGFMLDGTKQGITPPKVTMIPSAPDVYTID